MKKQWWAKKPETINNNNLELNYQISSIWDVAGREELMKGNKVYKGS